MKNGDTIALGALTILVGPNNAGKSQLLRDIGHCVSGKEEFSKVLESVDFQIVEDADSLLRKLLENEKTDVNGNFQIFSPNGDIVSRNKTQFTYRKFSESETLQELKGTFAYRIINYLTTEHRLTFSKRQADFANGNNFWSNSLAKLIFDSDEDIERWLSIKTETSFNLSIILDIYSNAGLLEFKVLQPDSHIPHDRIAARQFLQQQSRLDEQGDGLRSFVATLGSAKSLPGQILLIDEPEAFLHPPQAFQVGRVLGEETFEGKQIICATHSADFLRGVLAGGRDVTIVRLSRDVRGQRVSVLSPEDLRTIANDPVLSSGRILDGIFYQNVVITESDGDAVFYSAVSDKTDPAGETYYVNSYGKAATASVAEPYRKMGVPYAAIVDLDLIRVGAEFKKVARLFLTDSSGAESLVAKISQQIQSFPVEKIVNNTLQKIDQLRTRLDELEIEKPDQQLEWLRARINEIKSDASLWSDIKRSGINSSILDAETRSNLNKLLEQCASNGLFLVPAGEREFWLEPDVSYTKNKSVYTVEALNYIKSPCFLSSSLLSQFMKRVHQFLHSK